MGQAALAMWWDMAPAQRQEFEHWHSHEHFPERLALPGFERASRWAELAGGEGFFVLYELATYEALVSPEYQARLNAPTDWSRQMMPHHRNMVRSQCRVLASRGGVVAGLALTVHLSPQAGEEARLRAVLEQLVLELPARPGLLGAHLLRTDTPPLPATTEQKIRASQDRSADWIFIATGYDAAAVDALAGDELAPSALLAAGARDAARARAFALRACLAAAEASGMRLAGG